MSFHKPVKRRMPIVWIGECVCGLMAFELADGTRYKVGTNMRHTPEHCRIRRHVEAQSGEEPEAVLPSKQE